MRNKIILAATAWFLVSIVAGCAPRVVAPPPPGWIVTAPPEEVLARTFRAGPEDQILRTRARFTAESEQGRFSAGIFVFARRPADLRIESLSMIGLPELILTVNNRALKIFVAKERKFYIGSPDESLSRFFPILLDAHEAVSLMMGFPPALRMSRMTLEGRMDQGSYRIDFFSGGTRMQTLWIDPSRLELVKVEKWAGDKRLYTAVLEAYREVDGRKLPGRIEFRFENPRKLKLTLRFSESEWSSEGDELFDLEAPEGMEKVYLD
ncbi:MAG: hypothetical protein A4E73_00474 [Syntrophaceae bacterium PtaU1.Bin231]|nr:MAG: hypothetical protein A4E73_00474 [Syntrophaceae bacterium PtaU1.Bin231]